jgi:hypothetical protein
VAQAGQKAVFHYDAGPRVKVRFTTFAAAGLDIETCPETNNALLPETEAADVLKPVTAALRIGGR